MEVLSSMGVLVNIAEDVEDILKNLVTVLDVAGRIVFRELSDAELDYVALESRDPNIWERLLYKYLGYSEKRLNNIILMKKARGGLSARHFYKDYVHDLLKDDFDPSKYQHEGN